MGGVVRYKAEVDFDGREITQAYLYKQDMDAMLLVRKYVSWVLFFFHYGITPIVYLFCMKNFGQSLTSAIMVAQ